MQRVLFIYPEPANYYFHKGRYSMGIGYLSAILKANGHQTKLFKAVEYFDFDKYKKIIEEFKPTIIGISLTENSFNIVKNYIKEIKLNSEVFLILGGVYPTLYPDELLKIDGIDAVCLGEGEFALLELCEKFDNNSDYTNIESIYFKTNDGKIIRNNIRKLIEDLDSLPFADRDIFDYEDSCEYDGKYMVTMAGRGCPFNCFYCANHSLKNIYPDKHCYVRFRSPQNVIKELKFLIKKFDWINFFIFDDDILTLNKKWLSEFSDSYKKEINIPYICNVQVKTLDEEIITLLKESNCIQVNIGIETGNEKLRKEVLNKSFTNEELKKVCKKILDKNIKIYTFNMCGIPGERVEDCLMTYKINADIKADYCQVSFFYPYKGTRINEIIKEELGNKEIESLTYLEEALISSRYNCEFAVFNFVKIVNEIKESKITNSRILELLTKEEYSEEERKEFNIPYKNKKNKKIEKIIIVRSSRVEHFYFAKRRIKKRFKEAEITVLLTKSMPEEKEVKNYRPELNYKNYEEEHFKNLDEYDLIIVLINNFERKGYEKIIPYLRLHYGEKVLGYLPNGWLIKL